MGTLEKQTCSLVIDPAGGPPAQQRLTVRKVYPDMPLTCNKGRQEIQ